MKSDTDIRYADNSDLVRHGDRFAPEAIREELKRSQRLYEIHRGRHNVSTPWWSDRVGILKRLLSNET